MNDSVGASDILRSSARRRERLASSMSLVASRPAALRPMEASETGVGREKKFCQGELTEAKPDRRDMTDIPMTPMRSREASLRLWELSMVGPWPTRCSNHCPLHQKANIHAVNPSNCSSHASLNLPLPLPTNSYPAAEMTEWISRKGIVTISWKRSSRTVTLKASPRAVGFMVLDISHSISSTSTAASAIVEEKVNADKCLMVVRAWPPFGENGRANALVFNDVASPERNGKSFVKTRVETRRKVVMKGRDANAIAVDAGIVLGLHSSQSSPAGSMGRYDERRVEAHRLAETMFMKVIGHGALPKYTRLI